MEYLQKIGKNENFVLEKNPFELVYRENLKESGNVFSQVNDIKVEDAEDGYVMLELVAGVYHFVIQK